jgi:hypothetical protein
LESAVTVTLSVDDCGAGAILIGGEAVALLYKQPYPRWTDSPTHWGVGMRTAAPRALCATVTAALAVGATAPSSGGGREAGHSRRGVPCCGVCVAAVRGKVDMKSQVFPRFLLRNTRGRGAKSQPGGSIDRFRRQQQNLSIWQQIPVSSIDRAKIGCWPR